MRSTAKRRGAVVRTDHGSAKRPELIDQDPDRFSAVEHPGLPRAIAQLIERVQIAGLLRLASLLGVVARLTGEKRLVVDEAYLAACVFVPTSGADRFHPPASFLSL